MNDTSSFFSQSNSNVTDNDGRNSSESFSNSDTHIDSPNKPSESTTTEVKSSKELTATEKQIRDAEEKLRKLKEKDKIQKRKQKEKNEKDILKVLRSKGLLKVSVSKWEEKISEVAKVFS